MYKTYKEFVKDLKKIFDGKVYFGATRKEISEDFCVLQHQTTDFVYMDDQKIPYSSTYSVVFFCESSVLSDDLHTLFDDGLSFIRVDDPSGKNIFTGDVTLSGTTGGVK